MWLDRLFCSEFLISGDKSVFLHPDAGRAPFTTDLFSAYRRQKERSEYLLCFDCFLSNFWASLVAQRLKRLPGMLETQVRSLGKEDPLEKEMATHSSTLAWRIPWREEPGRLQPMGSQRVGHD